MKIQHGFPESIPEDERNLDASGRVIDEGAASVAALNPDETLVRIPADTGLSRYPRPLVVVNREREQPVRAWMQLALARALQGMTPSTSLNLEALLANSADVQVRDFTLRTIIFDHPRQEDELVIPLATIRAEARVVYDHQDLQPVLLEETLHVFAPDTLLRKLATGTVVLVVVALFAHKEEARGFEATMEREFLAEPADDRGGRRIVIPEYYNRSARFDLIDCDRPDEDPQGNKWEVLCRLRTELDRVALVRSPGEIRKVQISVP